METYEEFINNILETRGRFACGEEYHERHHIVPKCMGGSNDEENLIDLFAREHFVAHMLLALEHPEEHRLVYAWNMMCNSKNGQYEITAEEYEQLRIEFSKAISGEGNPMYGIHRFGVDNPMYGKSCSQETKDKISNKMKDIYKVPENNPMYDKHHSQETKNKISDKLKDIYINKKDHPMYGKHHTKEAKEKMRKSKIGKYDGINNPKCRKVIRLSDLKVYNYLNEAAYDNNVCKSTMIRHCKSHRDFMYYDEWLTQQND